MKKNCAKELCMLSLLSGFRPQEKSLFEIWYLFQKFTVEQFGKKLLQRNQLNFKDHPGFSKDVLIKTIFFEEVIVICFDFENQCKKTCQAIKHFSTEGPAIIFGNNKTTFIRGRILHEKKCKDLALEVVEKKAISLCGKGFF